MREAVHTSVRFGGLLSSKRRTSVDPFRFYVFKAFRMRHVYFSATIRMVPFTSQTLQNQKHLNNLNPKHSLKPKPLTSRPTGSFGSCTLHQQAASSDLRLRLIESRVKVSFLGLA